MKTTIMKILGRTVILLILAVSTLNTAALTGELTGATLPDTLKAGDYSRPAQGIGRLALRLS
jgi:hypothetical protein